MFVNRFQLPGCSNIVGAIIRMNVVWQTSSADEPGQTAEECLGSQVSNNLKMDCLRGQAYKSTNVSLDIHGLPGVPFLDGEWSREIRSNFSKRAVGCYPDFGQLSHELSLGLVAEASAHHTTSTKSLHSDHPIDQVVISTEG